MKRYIPMVAALTVAFVSTTAIAEDPAQLQQEREACETDVYTFCNDAIPDQARIAVCLRKHWSEISHACRKVMNDHRRRHRSDDKERSRSAS